jgi:hypothetical protein
LRGEALYGVKEGRAVGVSYLLPKGETQVIGTRNDGDSEIEDICGSRSIHSVREREGAESTEEGSCGEVRGGRAGKPEEIELQLSKI